ncbi:GDSL esterase/lipase At4g16230-like [Nicotiana tabacum]|uniref:GDSL esterase/lipase At4g16230-like n=1 Tax=Nicotiana tabacum TaxID=4097 RepID=A0AC58SMS1_TOBAC
MGNPSYYRLAILGVVLQNLTICLAENVPANFVFGDSLVDVGNNNYIASLSKANFFPNGIDFGGPTGRYTNGRTIVDILGSEEVGFNLTPPYLAPTTSGPVVLQGVNYASGGGGILNESGQIFKETIDRLAVEKETILAKLLSADVQLRSVKQKGSAQAKRIEELETQLAEAKVEVESSKVMADKSIAVYRADAKAAQMEA